jgi:hypothetical protein
MAHQPHQHVGFESPFGLAEAGQLIFTVDICLLGKPKGQNYLLMENKSSH